MAKVYQDKRIRKRGGIRPWCISYVGLDGRRRRERTPATTKEEARELLRKKLSEISKATLGRAVEFGYDPTMKSGPRRAVMAKWKDWWEKNKSLIQQSNSR